MNPVDPIVVALIAFAVVAVVGGGLLLFFVPADTAVAEEGD